MDEALWCVKPSDLRVEVEAEHWTGAGDGCRTRMAAMVGDTWTGGFCLRS